MGAWGIYTFDNDDAVDWLEELLQSNELLILFDTLEMIQEGILEEPEVCNALAAAEIVAALKGKPRNNLPQPALQWTKQLTAGVTNELQTLALFAVDAAIAEDSELNQLWQGSDDYQNWLDDIAELKAVLQDKS